MGWGDCGHDSNGRPIGYVFAATCDHPGCDAQIDRGLSYACGGMHGEDDHSCEGYFCGKHMVHGCELKDGKLTHLCVTCTETAEANGALVDD